MAVVAKEFLMVLETFLVDSEAFVASPQRPLNIAIVPSLSVLWANDATQIYRRASQSCPPQ